MVTSSTGSSSVQSLTGGHGNLLQLLKPFYICIGQATYILIIVKNYGAITLQVQSKHSTIDKTIFFTYNS